MELIKKLSLGMTLGEGPVWNSPRSSRMWLDILEQKLYELPFENDVVCENPCVHSLGFTGSCIAVQNETSVIIVAKQGVFEYNLENRLSKLLVDLALPEHIRTNDGVTSPDGKLWFSTMELSPTGSLGAIYCLDQNMNMSVFCDKIGIPNTFVFDSSNNSFLLSDSLKQQTYSFPLDNNYYPNVTKKALYMSTEMESYTPDGGAMDVEGNLWLAFWGAGKIQCLDQKADTIAEIELEALHVTSCCFGGSNNNYLLITSAQEGLNDEQLSHYPQSGSVFIYKLNVTGQSIPNYKMENRC